MLSVEGWALLAGTTLARVEVAVDGRSVGLARLGLNRSSVGRRRPDRASAPISGFSLVVDLDELPSGGGVLSVAAVAVGLDGVRHTLEPIEVPAAEAEPVSDESRRGRAAELRRRGERFASAAADAAHSTDAAVPLLLVFTHDLRRAGAELHLVELLERLLGHGRFAATVVSAEDGPLRARLERLGAEVHLCGDFGLDGVEAYEGRMSELLAWCAPRRPDAVVANTLLAFPGVDLAGRLGLPSAFVLHESAEFPRWSPDHDDWLRGHRYPRLRAASALAEASVVLFPAEATRRQYVHLGRPERFRTLPIGINLEPIDARLRRSSAAEARRELGLPEHGRIVLCLGTWQPRKAQAPLAQAFGAVAERHPDVRLCLVGETGDSYARSLRLFVSRAGLDDRVVMKPVVDDPLPWHAAADLEVVASDRESLPRVALEAMAFGTPVLGTSVFGMPDLLRGGRAGDLCPPRDVEALAAGLDRALGRDPGDRERMVRDASEAVRSDHDARRYAEAFEEILLGLLAEGGAAKGREASA